MNLEGDLGDVSLASLIQLMGTNRRSGGIVLKRPGQTGLVYFVGGEIVDAATGADRGEEAVCRLLSWDEAAFEVREELVAPARSIRASWKQLLFDSMRRIDEGKHQDETEDDFVALMSALEQVLVKLRDDAIRQQPEQALVLYGDQVNRAAEFWAALPEIHVRTSLKTLLTEVARERPAARLLEADGESLAKEHLEVVARSLGQPRGVGVLLPSAELSVAAVCGALLEVLERYLGLIVQHFRSPKLREQWSETCSFFVLEARATLELVEL